MTDEDKRALLQEIVEATHIGPPAPSFTVEDYVAYVEEEGGHIGPDTARKRLVAKVRAGELEGRKFASGGSERWHFWKPAKNPQ